MNHTERVVSKNGEFSLSSIEETIEPAILTPMNFRGVVDTVDECTITGTLVSNPLCTESTLTSTLGTIESENATFGSSFPASFSSAETAVTTQTNSTELTSDVTYRLINEAFANNPMLMNTKENYLVPNTGPKNVIVSNPFDDEFTAMAQRSDASIFNDFGFASFKRLGGTSEISPANNLSTYNFDVEPRRVIKFEF